MATKKKAKKSAKKGTAKKRGGAGQKKTTKLLRTKFIADFTKTFIVQGKTRIWPANPPPNKDAVAADFQTFAKVLFTMGIGLPAPAVTDALGAQLVAFLTANNWPNDPRRVPAHLITEYGLGTIALVEIAVIMDRLLESVSAAGLAGDNTRGWPPH